MKAATAITTANWQNDFRYWVLRNDDLVSFESASAVPDELWDDACTISEAVSHVQRIGCSGRCQHTIRNNYHATVLAVLQMAVKEYGQVFDVVYRGDSSARPDSDYRIMFATRDSAVAKFYGTVQERQNVRGLLTKSLVKSVVTDDYAQCDEEIIFFPN